jgi:hypothetical protein
MRRPRLRHLAFALTFPMVASAVLATTVGAQSSRRLSLQVSGLEVGVFGDAYEGLKSGPGFEAQLRFNPSAFSIGGGFQFSHHGLTEEGLTGESVSLAGAFVEPRYVIDVHSDRLAPYASARLAYLRQALAIDDLGLEAHASGTQLNLGGGLLVRMTSMVNLDVGLTVGAIHFGDVEVDESAFGSGTISGTSGSGKNLVFRVGVAIGLGR